MQEKLLNSREESFFDWDSQLDGLKERLRNNECKCVLISAPFGWGKSSFTNILRNELLEENKKKKFKEKPWDVGIIETWRYELLNPENVVPQLIYDILDSFFTFLIEKYLPEEITLDRKELHRFLTFDDGKIKQYSVEFIKEYLNTRFKKKHGIDLRNIEAIAKDIHESTFIKKIKTLKLDLEKNYLFALEFYKEFLETFLIDLFNVTENKNPKIVLIFRDCDRCSPENLLKIIDCLYHFHLDDRIKFIIEGDEDTIKSILCNKYHLGDYFDLLEENKSANYKKFQILDGYLDKIFDTTRIILNNSSINKKRLMDYLNNCYNSNFEKENYLNIDQLSQELKLNYRFIKNHIEEIVRRRLKEKTLLDKVDEIELNAIIILHIVNDLSSQAFKDFILPKIQFLRNDFRDEPKKLRYKIWDKDKQDYSDKFNSKEIIVSEMTIEKLENFVNSVQLKYSPKYYVNVFNFECSDYFRSNRDRDLKEVLEEINSKIDSINKKWISFNS